MKKYLISALFVLAMGIANAQTSAKLIETYSLSYQHENKQEYSSAIKVMESVYSATDYAVNLRLGWLCYLNSNLDQSEKYYAKALAIEPKSIEARFGLAYPQAALKQWDKLALNYEELLKVAPNNTVALYRLAYLYYNLANHNKSDGYLKTLLNVYPFDYYGNLLKGWNDIKLGKYKEAEDALNLVLIYKPGDQTALDAMKLLKK
jgi:tetratricopeptide (TPR) repeat protein